jgi:hypothetical protein
MRHSPILSSKLWNLPCNQSLLLAEHQRRISSGAPEAPCSPSVWYTLESLIQQFCDLFRFDLRALKPCLKLAAEGHPWEQAAEATLKLFIYSFQFWFDLTVLGIHQTTRHAFSIPKIQKCVRTDFRKNKCIRRESAALPSRFSLNTPFSH